MSRSAGRERTSRGTKQRLFPTHAVQMRMHADCAAVVALTIGEYEEVRKVPTHFVIAPGTSLWASRSSCERPLGIRLWRRSARPPQWRPGSTLARIMNELDTAWAAARRCPYRSRSSSLPAATTAWRRLCTPSAAIRAAMWLRTVVGLGAGSEAISRRRLALGEQVQHVALPLRQPDRRGRCTLGRPRGLGAARMAEAEHPDDGSPRRESARR